MYAVKMAYWTSDQGTSTTGGSPTGSKDFNAYFLNGGFEVDTPDEAWDGKLLPTGSIRESLSVETEFMTESEANTFFTFLKNCARNYAYVAMDSEAYVKAALSYDTGGGVPWAGVTVDNVSFESGSSQQVKFDLTYRAKS